MPLKTRRSSSVAVLEVHGVIGNHIKIPEYATDRLCGHGFTPESRVARH